MNTDLLVELLNQKRDVLAQLRQLVEYQAPLVDGGDSRKLLGLLATKEKLLTRLKQVEAGLDPFRDEDPEQRVWRNAADRMAARDIHAECDRSLAEVMEIDQADMERLIARHDFNEQALGRIHTARAVNDAYAPPTPHHTGRLDLSSD